METKTSELNILFEKCLKNDRQAQKALFDLYSKKVMAVSFTYMEDQNEAEDVLQESFIKMFKNLDKCNNPNELWSWLKRIVINTAIDKLRMTKKNRNLISYDQTDHFTPLGCNTKSNPEYILTQQELSSRLKNAISKLSPSYKTIFNMFALENYSHAEIAEKLGVSIGTSKSQYFKAKAKLRQMLGDEMISLYLTK
jgi:RNA polymerase sigma-70 factor (ECF subfamily)